MEQYNIRDKLSITTISKLEELHRNGLAFNRKIYKLNNLIDIYISDMKEKNCNMGDKYISDMVSNIYNIINSISRQSSYDKLEFVNLVIKYVLKMISFLHTKQKNKPTLPDYTLDEIRDLCLSI